jgi:hypothetical protein
MFLLLQFLTGCGQSQPRYITHISLGLGEFYKENSPLDYLQILKNDFKKTTVDIIMVFPPPHDWVAEQHLEDLIKLVYKTDSIKCIVSFWSSNLPLNKFSSIGREAQNLIGFFRVDKRSKSYPPTITSFGLPDQVKARELEEWWAAYNKAKEIH